MNNSEKTVHIARGIYYCALVMNMSADDFSPIGKVQRAMWEKWANTYPQWVELVMQEQHNLFDRLL